MLGNNPKLWRIVWVKAALLLWLAIACGSQTSPETDREALIALYNTTDGPNWRTDSNWLSDAPMDDWYGVTTNRRGRVTKLYLGGNEMSGEIPPELGNLDKLKVLDIGDAESVENVGSDAGKFMLAFANIVTSYSPPHANDLTGCIPINLRRQLDQEKSVLGDLHFCDGGYWDQPKASSIVTLMPTCSGGSDPGPLDPAPLHVAVRARNVDEVRNLASLCPEDLNFVHDAGRYRDQTPLSLAIREQDAEVAQILLAAGADPNKRVRPRSRVGTHLTYAVELGNTEIVTILLDAGADPNVIDTEQFYDESPLSVAVQAQDAEMVRVLIAAGADPKQKLDRFNDETPLDIAINEGYTEIIEILEGSSN